MNLKKQVSFYTEVVEHDGGLGLEALTGDAASGQAKTNQENTHWIFLKFLRLIKSRASGLDFHTRLATCF